MSIVKVTIPPELTKVLENIKHVKKRESLIAIYRAFVYKSSYVVEGDYFDVPSAYLNSIRSKPEPYKQILYDNNIIEYQSKKSSYIQNQTNIFEEPKEKKHKYYDTERGQCMRYRFLIDTNNGIETEIEIDDNYKKKQWYSLTKSSLNHLGLEVRIKRDNFGRRLHTPITQNMKKYGYASYKSYFKDKGYVVIDAIACQPTLLYYLLKQDNKKMDDNFIDIFENDKDFYTEVANKSSSTRDKVKELFNLWVFSKKIPTVFNELFPIINQYIRYEKYYKNYKTVSQQLQRLESKIFIDMVLNTIPTDFCLTVHDSIIIKEEFTDKAYEYVNEIGKNYNLKFKINTL